MGRPLEMGHQAALAAQEAAQATGPIVTPSAEISAPVPPGAMLVRRVDLDDYASQHYPDLRRGMVVTVERPWQTGRPLLSLLSWRIRARQAEIMDLESERVLISHAMLYAGMGRCWSQGPEFGIEHLDVYSGCTLHFWDNPAWGLDDSLRHHLMSDCGPHVGQDYAYRDIAGLWAWAATGNERWLERLGDGAHWYCSEAVCVLMRGVEARVGREFMPGQPAERVLPQVLHNHLLAQGWPCVALRID